MAYLLLTFVCDNIDQLTTSTRTQRTPHIPRLCGFVIAFVLYTENNFIDCPLNLFMYIFNILKLLNFSHSED